MSTKNTISAIFILSVVLGVVLLSNHVFGFTGPSAPFPACDLSVPGCNTPLNIGTSAQVKNGDLGVNAFLASANAEFAQKLIIDGLAGKTYTNGGVSYDHSLCANANGNVEACEDAQKSPEIWTTSGAEKGNDLVEATLTINSQIFGRGPGPNAKWTVTRKVLMSSDPAHISNPLPLNIYAYNAGGQGCSATVDPQGTGYVDATGTYRICLGQENGSGPSSPSAIGVNYNLLSIQYISSNVSPLKVTPFSTGNNEISFLSSNGGTPTDLKTGDKVVLLYMVQNR